MKPVIITLLYLTFGGNIEQTSFEIATGESCSSWFNRNVKVMENKKKKLFSRLSRQEEQFEWLPEKGEGVQKSAWEMRLSNNGFAIRGHCLKQLDPKQRR